MPKIRIVKRVFQRKPDDVLVDYNYYLEVDGRSIPVWDIMPRYGAYCVYDRNLKYFLGRVAVHFGVDRKSIPIIERPAGKE